MSSEDHTNEQIIQAINDGHNRYSLLLKSLKISETSLKYRLKKLKQAKKKRSYLTQEVNKIYYNNFLGSLQKNFDVIEASLLMNGLTYSSQLLKNLKLH